MLDIISTTTTNSPKIFGLVHFIVLFVFIVLTILVCVFLRKTNSKQHQIILIVVASVLIIFEILKQILLIYDSGNYEYDWQHLPLQPCSALMYSLLFVAITCNFKKFEKFNEWIYAFIAIYGFFSGISAIVMPSAIFNTSYVFLLYQSVQHHMLLALTAIYLFVRGNVSLKLKTFFKAFCVFLFWCLLGFILNLILYAITGNAEINLMYMGPYTIWEIPLVSSFLEINNIYIYISFYLAIYSAMALLSMYVYLGIEKLVLLINNKIKKSRQPNQNNYNKSLNENK